MVGGAEDSAGCFTFWGVSWGWSENEVQLGPWSDKFSGLHCLCSN